MTGWKAGPTGLLLAGAALAALAGCTVAPHADRIVLIEYHAAATAPAAKPEPQTAAEILEETNDWVETNLRAAGQP